MQIQFGNDFANEPGAGAAGGLGFGLMAFARARLTPGFELIAREAKLDAALRRSDLVITGEGRLDRSTLMGKGVGELAKRCCKIGVHCIALGGEVSDRQKLEKIFHQLYTLTDLTSATRARAEPKLWLERLAAKSAQRFHQA